MTDDIQSKRLIAPIIDAQARSRPDDVVFSIPKDDNDLSQGFSEITCKTFANAINHAAAWLQTQVGTNSGGSFDVLSYQGPNDLRYPILAVAASKVGKQILFPFSLAPNPVKKHLILSSQTKVVLHCPSSTAQVKEILSDTPNIQSIPVPSLDTWLHGSEVSIFHYPKTYDQGKNDPWLIFHTSGTTGFPKTITYTNLMMTSFDIATTLPDPIEQTQLGWHKNRRCFSVAPLSHFSGLCAALQTPLFLNSIVIQGPSTKPPSPQTIVETLRFSKAEGFVAPPFLLRGLARNPATLEVLKSMKYIQWVGAALDSETGSAISQHVRLCPAIGTTECGPYFLHAPEDTKEEWKYYSFQQGQGIEFIQRGENLHELVFKKAPEAAWQQVFLVFPEIEIYETKDLFRPHGKKEGLWEYVGRSDDIVVLSNSANVNAAEVEEKICTHPKVQAAFVGGSGRDKTFAVLELSGEASREMDGKSKEDKVDAIWEAFNEANKGLSEYTKIRKEYVIVTGSECALVKSPKGGIMRGPSLKLFEKDIEEIYAGQ